MINVTSETLLDGSRDSLCQQTYLTLTYDTAKCQMTPLTRLVMRPVYSVGSRLLFRVAEALKLFVHLVILSQSFLFIHSW